ncbi:MAG TPA: GNAT family N-acyltransferase [Micromonosporaceae bacterium]|nr:GNAT family N-acyltransferase [Micromonosporaceae bacterium]
MTVLLTAPSGYTTIVADNPTEVAAAQRLRHRVFAEELGANLPTAMAGLDVDEFDDHCDHLIVRDDATGEAVGTYRMLPPSRAHVLGRRYSDGEFDTSALDPLRDQLVEMGRSCVHPDYRSGAVMSLMWAGIARYLLLNGYRWLGGCASVGLDDGGAAANAMWRLSQAKHLAPPMLRVRPRLPWVAADGVSEGGKIPPLVRGYLRLGAWVCGEPAHDPDFDCADFYMLLSLDRTDPRYLRHFLGESG